LIGIIGEERLSITFIIGKDDITRNEHMSITFRIGKDNITRKINTCLLPLELVKTIFQEIKHMPITFKMIKTTKINRLGIGRTGSLGTKGRLPLH